MKKNESKRKSLKDFKVSENKTLQPVKKGGIGVSDWPPPPPVQPTTSR
jgi:hypothetical protein